MTKKQSKKIKQEKEVIKKQKGFSPLIGLIIVVILGLGAAVGYYFYDKSTEIDKNANVNTSVNQNANTNTNQNLNTNTAANLNTNQAVDETAGWETYNNEQFHYTLKYPSDWDLTEVHERVEPGLSNYTCFYNSQVREERFCICPENRGNDSDCEPFQDAEWDSTTTTLSIDGYSAEKIFYTPKYKNPQDEYYCKTCTDRATITLTTKPSGWEEGRDFLLGSGPDSSLEVQNKMLSTFQFTDETADWQTYTNTELGYSLKYPEGLTMETINGDIVRFTGENQAVTLSIFDRELDPNNIEGVYGAVEATQVEVGDQVGYQYRGGDAGCAGIDIQTGLPTNQILRIAFITCSEEQNDFYTDSELREDFLSTFQFPGPTENNFSFNTVKADDEIGGMTVSSVGPLLDRPDIPIVENAKIEFDGRVTVTGTYQYYADDYPFLGDEVCMQEIDATSQEYMPKAKEDTRQVWFCFINKEKAQSEFIPSGSTGQATVIIDNYIINFAGTEVFNTAELVEVVSK